MSDKTERKKTLVNIISSVGVLCVNIMVSFFLSPYIIRTIGVEANGFVNLANNFVTYANLIVIALNAMAARFITIAYVNKDYNKANLYYNSVFWGNLIIVLLLLLPASGLIMHLERFVDIPKNLIFDVKVTFAFIFLSFFLRTGFPNWDCGTYITNRLDRTYIPSIVIALMRVVFLICLFAFFSPHIWYVGLVGCLVTLAALLVAGYNTHTLTPNLKITLKPIICSLPAIKELVGSGIWNAINVAGNMLFSSFDLLICNLLLGATPMGILSLSKTIPSILVQLAESIRGAAGADITISYAKGNKTEMLSTMKDVMRITSAILPIPVGGVIIMGSQFYKLWVPSQDYKLLSLLTILALINSIMNSGIIVLYSVFTVVNKVRINAIVMLISGGFSVILTLVLAYFTDYDLYVVAGVSSVVTTIRDLIFTIPVASKFLGFKWYVFYPQVLISCISTGIVIVVGMIIKLVMPIDNWGMFFLACSVTTIISFFANTYIILTLEERRKLYSKLKKKLHITR